LCKRSRKTGGYPREVTHWDERFDRNRRKKRARAEEAVTEVIRSTLDGLSRRDVRPFLSSRMPKLFSLFDDFPPFDLLDYEKAAEHNSVVDKTY
jgi:hypothetical protein